jgi:hypothetical protein
MLADFCGVVLEVSLYSPCDAARFDVNRLGPVLGSAVEEQAVNAQVSREIIGSGALGLLSTAVADLYDVQLLGHAPIPTSLYVWIIAGTGEGKDFGVSPFAAPFIALQAREEETARQSTIDLRADIERWADVKSVLRQRRKAALRDNEETAGIDAMIAQHEQSKPIRQQSPKLIYDQATVSSIEDQLCRRWPTACQFNLDAGGYFSRAGAAWQGFWNARWGGSPIVGDTIERGSVFCESPRLSCVLGIQPTVLFKLLGRLESGAFHESGFVARPLIAIPPPAAASRVITGLRPSTERISACQSIVAGLLQESLRLRRSGKHRRAILEFSPAAERFLVDHANRHAALTAHGKQYFYIAGHALKATQNVARIAAVLHVINETPGDISEDTTRCAADLMAWYTSQSLLLSHQTNPAHRLSMRAVVLEEFVRRAHLVGCQYVSLRDLRFLWQFDAKDLKEALNYLRENARLEFGRFGRTECVWLAPLARARLITDPL